MTDPSHTILVTGAAGFVGRALCRRLVSQGRQVVGTFRTASAAPEPGVTQQVTGDLSGLTDWSGMLAKVDVVVHCAARVHVMDDTADDPLKAFRAVNVVATRRLAEQAAAAGVKRLVFLSSIKVNGEETPAGRPFTSQDLPRPIDPYGISKLEAEQALREVAAETGLEVVIIRPVLVYGAGVKANFRAMMKLLLRGLPLPLGSVDNRRSLVALDNLIDLIIRCLDHPAASGETFLVSDGEDLSTTELLERMALAMETKALLFPVPAGLLVFGARALGKSAIAQRLCGSLQVDITHTTETLGWRPPVSVDEGLRRVATEFRESE